MANTDAIICPQCKIAMNYHAEKIDYAAALTEPDAADPDLGGILEEVHTCPKCGGIETRRATAG
jgi:hypothetical protein